MSARQTPNGSQPQPPSGRKPESNPAVADVTAMADELQQYHGLFHDLFVRSEQRTWSAFYLQGHLSGIECKSIEPMVLALKGPDRAAVRAAQQFLGEGAWDDTVILERHQSHVATDLGQDDAALIVDGSGFPKQGTHSVGVARQYCGHLSKTANCQHGVFVAYSSSEGYTFVDRRLYMPAKWFDTEHAALRDRYGVLDDLVFTTEPQLALEMISTIVQRGVLPLGWVLGDETYGADPKVLDGIDALQKRYFLEVPVSTRAWVGSPEIQPAGRLAMGALLKRPRVAASTPKARKLWEIAAELPATAWRRYTISEGSKGSNQAQFAFLL